MRKVALALLRLPDGRYAFQRRDDKAPTSPCLLGLFGGQIEGDETPGAGIRRELREETSLDIDKLELALFTTFTADTPPYEEVFYYLYEADIPVDNFAVYEGDGMEAYSLETVLQRDDLAKVLQHPLTLKTKEEYVSAN